jgi:hypothetical protein
MVTISERDNQSRTIDDVADPDGSPWHQLHIRIHTDFTALSFGVSLQRLKQVILKKAVFFPSTAATPSVFQLIREVRHDEIYLEALWR